jgi:hypothetical protein
MQFDSSIPWHSLVNEKHNMHYCLQKISLKMYFVIQNKSLNYARKLNNSVLSFAISFLTAKKETSEVVLSMQKGNGFTNVRNTVETRFVRKVSQLSSLSSGQ